MANIVKQDYLLTMQDRNSMNGHNSFVIWFTGLSGSGKSTVANRLEEVLYQKGIHTYSLDGDNIRRGLNRDLGFSEEDRCENLRRTAEIAKLFVDAGLVTITALISPLKKDRKAAKDIIGEENFVEVFMNTPLDICEKRDVKGLYKKARSGEIKNFTGISSTYERPVNPEVEIKTEEEGLEESVQKILGVLNIKKLGI